MLCCKVFFAKIVFCPDILLQGLLREGYRIFPRVSAYVGNIDIDLLFVDSILVSGNIVSFIHSIPYCENSGLVALGLEPGLLSDDG